MMQKVYSEMLEDIFYNYDGPSQDILKYIPRFFKLLQRIYLTDGLDWRYKFTINAAFSYFAIPEDVIPDHDIENGYIDDLFICSYVLWDLLDEIPDVVKAKWSGPEDIAELVDEIMERTGNKLGDLEPEVLGLVGLSKFSAMVQTGSFDFDPEVDKDKRIMLENQIYSLRDFLTTIYSFLGHHDNRRLVPLSKLRRTFTKAQWEQVIEIREKQRISEEVFDVYHEEEMERIRREVLLSIDKSIYM